MTTPHAGASKRAWISAALETLGVEQLALIAFDAALPRDADWDFGTGSPYSGLAREFFGYVHSLGFNAVQFGPQGLVSREYPSPYDSTVLSRNPLSLAFDQLQESEALQGVGSDFGAQLAEKAREAANRRGLSSKLREREVETLRATQHQLAFDCQSLLTDELARQLIDAAATSSGRALQRRFRRWCVQHGQWLLADAAYDVLCREHAATDFEQFPFGDVTLWHSPLGRRTRSLRSLLGHGLTAEGAARLGQLFTRRRVDFERYAWVQFLLHEQHDRLRGWTGSLGLQLFGDLQVGYSRRDLWHFRSLFLPGYRLGAPPSRTNPEGQPWGYPLIDPSLFFDAAGRRGPGLGLMELRASKSFAEYDRLRIDHPHGLVCPWVYKSDTGNDLRAVQRGARLFSSPTLRDHPKLARFALVDEAALDTSLPRYADGWVRNLTPRQVERYAACFSVLVEQAGGDARSDRLICEVLSTQPNPLGAVREHYGLGRFRVIQKANVDDPTDVYSSANATERDWVMVGNHDTPTIWQLLQVWRAGGELERQARYLARRLSTDAGDERRLFERLRSDPSELAHAKFADLFISDAKNVLISFGDLFGFTQEYNVPGTISASNWSQRIARDFEGEHHEAVRAGRALDLERVLRLALAKVAPAATTSG